MPDLYAKVFFKAHTGCSTFLCWRTLNYWKVHIFWEGHKILQNLHHRFVLCSNGQIYVRWRFPKIVWPSQNIWTLINQPERKLAKRTSVHWIYYTVTWKLKKQLVQTRLQENKNATLEIILPHFTSPGGKKLQIDWIALFSLKIGR